MKKSAAFHPFLCLLAVAMLSGLGLNSSTTTVPASLNFASQMELPASQLAKAALDNRSGFSMEGWALGDPMPASPPRLEIKKNLFPDGNRPGIC